MLKISYYIVAIIILLFGIVMLSLPNLQTYKPSVINRRSINIFNPKQHNVETTGLENQQEWKITISNTSLRIPSLYPTHYPSAPPPIIAGSVPGIDASLFTPLKQGEPICTTEGHTYLEHFENGKWIRLCDQFITPISSELECVPYDSARGYPLFGYLAPLKNCSDQLSPSEPGTYRLKTTVYTQCEINNQQWNQVSLDQCKQEKILYSEIMDITE